MRNSSYTAFVFLVLASFSWPTEANSQSRDQNFPTPVTSSEIAGVIPARDVGDARLTSYFYKFDGSQGDIFINVVTKNLTGDIDIFTAGTIQPLTKIVVYADSLQSETGRVIYLRRPARLLLRVEGRSPNDDPATFRIKFAGSFTAMAGSEKDEAPVIDRSERSDSTGVTVNSVGTIIETPKPKETVKTIPAEEKVEAKVEPPSSAKFEVEDSESVAKPVDPPKVRITPAPDVKTVIGGRAARSRAAKKEAPPKADKAAASKPADVDAEAVPASESKVDPLASINLVILMKDGALVQHPMNEVLRFSVDKGVLTVITKDRKTSRFSILNVERVTIQ